MKTIAHISDLHFGTVEPELVEGLTEDLLEVNPDLLVVSGDLTQRARIRQFTAAKSFLEKLPFPKLIVPGNHDVPLFDIFRRFLSPLTRYKKYISEDLNPFYTNDRGFAIYGINTARSFTWKEGRISVEQMKELERKICPLPDSMFKIVVTHHPFIPPPDDDGIKLVGRSSRALVILDKCDVDLLLAGHLHQGYSGDVRRYYPKTNSSIVVVQASTAISNRIREQPNGYNLLTVEPGKIFIQVREWNGERFTQALEITYVKENKEWHKLDRNPD